MLPALPWSTFGPLASPFTASGSPTTEQGDDAVWNVSAVSKELDTVNEDADACAAVANLFDGISLATSVDRRKSSDKLPQTDTNNIHLIIKN
jgi:hypothetical protein